MNILFLTLVEFDRLSEQNLYTDLLREFVNRGHFVYAISTIERREGKCTYLSQNERNAKVLRLRIGNTQKTNMLEKGISTVTLERLFIHAIRRFTAQIRFDLVLYSTPPITFYNAVRFVKKRDGAKTYLLLKDIFPQNALDLGMLGKTGIKGMIYRMFRQKERMLYRISDYIGCMSPANVRYVKRHNVISKRQVIEVNPNCICPSTNERITEEERRRLRRRYRIPEEKIAFLYGGNLGKPQDVAYIIRCLRACASNPQICFVIAGAGTERHLLREYVKRERPKHVRLLPQLKRDAYERVARCCDVGLIFLDHRFTIPNFPSRLLSYLDAGLPVLAATDRNTDIGQVIRKGAFGFWCESTGTEGFVQCVELFSDAGTRLQQGRNARKYLEQHYTAKHGYEIIMRHFAESER